MEAALRNARADLSETERLSRQILAGSPHPMWVFDADTLRFLDVNTAALAIYGYSRAEFLGLTLYDIRPAADRPLLSAHLQKPVALNPAEGLRRIWRHQKKSGALLWMEVASQPICFAGRPARIVIAHDVTKEADAQERLRRSEAHKAAILETAIDCIIGIDQTGCVTEWNPASTETFGYTHAEAVGRGITELIIPPRLRGAHRRGLAHFLATSEGPVLNQRIEVPALHKDGWEFPVELTVTAVQVEGSPVFTAYIRSLTERKALEHERELLLSQTEALLAEALERADYDPLTGLLNHRTFHKRLKEELAKEGLAEKLGRRGAVLLLDLDNFKFFNDAYGHLAGDDVLRQISLAFRSVCRPSEVLARFGGDEFALLLPGASPAEASARADALRAAVSKAGYKPPGYEATLPFTLSVGWACFPGDAETPTGLLEAADARLRVAKSGGDAESLALTLRRSLAASVGGWTMLDALVTAVDNKDRYTRRHSEDVMAHSLQIARALGLDPKAQRTVEIAALLHDVGKIGVPDAILRKPGRLTEEDFEAIKQHPLMGAAIVGAVPGFEETLDAVRHHHERWDGDGYPFGLRGQEIPLAARLMAVADAYSAMTTDRPYRQGMAPQSALQILEDGAGTQWDPECVQVFLQARRAA